MVENRYCKFLKLLRISLTAHFIIIWRYFITVLIIFSYIRITICMKLEQHKCSQYQEMSFISPHACLIVLRCFVMPSYNYFSTQNCTYIKLSSFLKFNLTICIPFPLSFIFLVNIINSIKIIPLRVFQKSLKIFFPISFRYFNATLGLHKNVLFKDS